MVNPSGAQWGVWYIHPNIWRDIVDNGNWACICTGNEEDDFEIVKSIDDIKELAQRSNNVLMKMSAADKTNIIDVIRSVFPGSGNEDMRINLMLKLKDTKNMEFNSIFDEVFEKEQNNSFSPW